MGNIKQINIKNCTYYFFNDMINIKIFDLSLLKIDKSFHGCVKKDTKITNINPCH